MKGLLLHCDGLFAVVNWLTGPRRPPLFYLLNAQALSVRLFFPQWANYYGGYPDYNAQGYQGYTPPNYQSYNSFQDPQFSQWPGYSIGPQGYGVQPQAYPLHGQAYTAQPQQAHGYPHQYPPPESPAAFVPVPEVQPPLPAEAAPLPPPPLPPPPPPPPPFPTGDGSQDVANLPESKSKVSVPEVSVTPKV